MTIKDLNFDDLIPQKGELSFDDLIPAKPQEGAAQTVAIGTGRMVDKLASGLKQGVLGTGAVLAELLPNKLKESAQGAIAEELTGLDKQMAESDRLYAPLQKESPWLTGAGEMLPLLATPMLRPLSGAGAGTTIANAAISGAAPAMLEHGTAEERAKRGAIGFTGGAAGGALGAGISRAIQPNRVPITQTKQAAIEAADRLGVKLSAGEQTGSRPLRWAESALEDLPISGGMAQKRFAENAAALNRGAAKAMGQQADELTPEVFANARQVIGGQFDQLLGQRQITLDQSFRAEVQAITGSKVLKELRDESVEALLEPFRTLPAGKIKVDGDWFQQNKTALDSAIRSAYTAGENGKAKALEGFEKALDRAARRSMSDAEKTAYDAAIKQWASLRLLETGKVVEGGKVMPGRLDQALNSRYRAGYKEGKITGELADIASLAQTMRPPPQSGTTPRAIYSGAAGGLAMMEPTSAAMMFAAPGLSQAFLQSPAGRKYLTQGLFGVGPMLDESLIRGGGLLGLSALAAQD